MALSIQYTSSGQGFTVDPGTYQAMILIGERFNPLAVPIAEFLKIPVT
jgi:hypothetical protein